MAMSIISAVLVMAALGVILSLVLGIAAKVFYVEVDPRIELISDILPGANCGGCGYAGCSDYAEAIVLKGEAPNKCVAGGANVVEGICSLMGQTIALGERKVAKILCQGNLDNAVRRFQYQGAQDCRAAILSTGGDKACEYGCVGLGTCVQACPFQAMTMGEDGLPKINEELCTGCGNCVKVCPRNIPQLISTTQKTAVLCSSHDAGKTVKEVCKVGCISCGICAKKCPEKAIKLQDKLAVVQADKCTGQKVCIEKCPTGAIQSLR